MHNDKIKQWLLTVEVWVFAIMVMYPEWWIRQVPWLAIPIMAHVIGRVGYAVLHEKWDRRFNYSEHLRQQRGRLRQVLSDRRTD